MSTQIEAGTKDIENFGTVFDEKTLFKKGLCPVSDVRKKKGNTAGPAKVIEKHSLYYEIHGTGPIKLVLIMGLNTSSFAFNGQVGHFSKVKDENGNDKYSILVFDNRGIGNSTTPRGPYSTKGMAKDVVSLLEHVGWTEPRGIHVVGVSMGGMIALKLALLIPERIVSLSLVVTSAGNPGRPNFPPWSGTKATLKANGVKDRKQRVPLMLPIIFTKEWLDAPVDPEEWPEYVGMTNYEAQEKINYHHIEVSRPQTALGAFSQMAAGLGHQVSNKQLRKIATSIPKVLIICGSEDKLVPTSKSVHLSKVMKEAEYIVMEKTGHGIITMRKNEFNATIERVIGEGIAALGNGEKAQAQASS